ncbi:Cytochrome P450, E-class, group I [Trema orientale]|uniref:Cytochrome P450, E-class, group I n=1 Tax=Trema orientale TaxID=63057 RepID=A0A2P5DYV9_TREOI|nr:Cytochrome P450, E-class, group I [Trema orientale]
MKVNNFTDDISSFSYRYGLIFRTSIAGKPVVVSADPEFNNFIFQQEGKLVELWYMDTFSNVFVLEGESRMNAVGAVHKYIRSTLLGLFGTESLKEKLLPQLEQVINKSLSAWSTQASVEVKHVASAMVLNFSAKQIFSYDAENSPENLSEAYSKIIDSLIAFPLNIPGTVYHQCMKDVLKERRTSPESHRGDFLDQILKDTEKEKFLTEDFILQLIFGVLFGTFESMSAIMALSFTKLSEHPSVLEGMIAEHEAILKNRENHPNSPLTWDEYKSMTFTLQVINETLRLGNVAPGILRRALKDIPVKGFTVPAGWTIMLVTSAQQLSPNTFHNPLEFNPWRWKELDSRVISKNFMPFGGGNRQCVGAEYSKVFLATFFHVLVTKYRWTLVKGAKVSRNPILGFGKGVHVKFSEK